MALDLTCPAGHAFFVPQPTTTGSTSCPRCGQAVALPAWSTETCAWMRSPVTDSTPAGGQRIGRFVLLNKVGEGAAGVVFRAYDPSLDRHVALKVPRAGLLDQQDDIAAFLREGLAAGKLRHPNIVPVHEAGQADGICYIASAFIEGRTLKSAIEESGRMPPPQAAELVARLAAALHYAHERGVVHRDIKPGNIMLGADGEPQIMDFGLAHRAAGETLQTVDGVLVGTPAYMSPEQAAGRSSQVDARSDLWSLGVVLYELLTGARPFDGELGPLLSAIQHREPIPPRKLKRSIPRDLETICLKCLAKSPAQRYASCDVLAGDLQRFGRGEPIVARPVSRLERTIRWCRRQPALAAALGLAGAFLIAAASLGGYHLAFRSAASQETERLAKDLGSKEKLVLTAQSKASQEQQRADAESRAKQRQICENKLTRALELCAAGDIDHGLLLMADALNNAKSAGAADLDRVLRLNIAAWASRLITLEQVVRQPDSSVIYCQFSANGQRLVTGGSVQYVWDLPRGAVVAKTRQREDFPLAIGWGPGDSTFLFGSTQRIAKCNVATGAPLFTLGNPERGRWDGIAFSRDGRRVLLWKTFAKAAELWDVESGKRVAELAHDDIVSGAISPDRKTVVTGGFLGQDIKMWNADTGEPLPVNFIAGTQPNHVQFTGDGRKLLACGGRMQLYDVVSGKAAGKIMKPPPAARAFTDYGVDLTTDGRLVAVRGDDNRVHIFESLTGEEFPSPLEHSGSVHRMAFSHDGRRLLTSSADGTARLWDAERSAGIGQPLRHGSPTFAVGFSPTSARFVSGDRDGSARVWREPAPARRLETKLTNAFTSFGFRGTAFADPKVRIGSTGLVAVLDWNQGLYSIRTWDGMTGKEGPRFAPNIQPHSIGMSLLAASADQTLIAIRWHDHSSRQSVQIRQLAVDTGTEVRQPIVLPSNRYSSAHVEYSPDGEVLLASTTNGAALFNSRTGEQIGDWLPPQSVPRRFSPDGKVLLCRASDGSMELRPWRRHDPRELA
ncbi:MAG TPA: serine/threonine-protein kinase, partial [Pirellulaceae bacterium]|nr:serine/threonine-protein kinase [Pirellulaceae bacterium]